MRNKFKVNKQQWRKWTPVSQTVFNELYKQMRDNPKLFQNAGNDWNVISWNAAFIAASEATEAQSIFA